MVAACSCMECQRRTGAVFGVMAFFKNDLVIEKLGECKSFERASDSGLGATTYFCPDCGSTVYAKPGSMPQFTAISVGCCGEPNFPEPQSAAWNATKHGWVCYPEHWSKSDNQKFD